MTPGSTEAQADRLPGVPPRLGSCAYELRARHPAVVLPSTGRSARLDVLRWHYRCRHHGGVVKPIPVVFHLGPLQVHTYGIGLALTFWFGYRYFAKRLPRPRVFRCLVRSCLHLDRRRVHHRCPSGARGREPEGGARLHPQSRGHPRDLARRPVELWRTPRRRAHWADLRTALVPPAPPRAWHSI